MIYHLTIHSPFGNTIRADVHAVNRASAEATLAEFVRGSEAYELQLGDAPDYGIALPELGIHHNERTQYD